MSHPIDNISDYLLQNFTEEEIKQLKDLQTNARKIIKSLPPEKQLSFTMTGALVVRSSIQAQVGDVVRTKTAINRNY